MANPIRLTRRRALSALAHSAAAGALLGPLAALAEAPAEAPEAVGEAFSFDLLTERMRAASTRPPAQPQMIGGFPAELTYDDYHRIRFRRGRERWSDGGSDGFALNAFHPGWLFKEPVNLWEVSNGQALPLGFSSEDFEYDAGLGVTVPPDFSLPGVAGFRLLHALNRADKMDELVAFLGASYFRALGQGNVYGLSARGLAVNTGLPGSEEFPRFTDFWLERPAPGSEEAVFHAALESRSVTGAYRFRIRPGATTEMEVTARLFLRQDIEQIGIAPLTSMFLFGGADPGSFDDFRPAVHDSEALVMTTRGGETFFRPLNNPAALAGSYLAVENPASFGLVQRQRGFETYLDAQAHYHLRPSLVVEPIGDWGAGFVRLIEIPSDLEVNDNIVAYWTPRRETRAGDALEYSYRLRWGMAPEGDGAAERARILRTRVGEGGVSGVQNDNLHRKFVIDFGGGWLTGLPEDAEITPEVDVARGTVIETVLSRLPGGDTWRLVIEAESAAEAGSAVELRALLRGYGRVLSETWLYQWVQE